MRRVVALALAIAAGLSLAGCSQIAAIAPVGGDHEAQVRYAAIDVLMDAGTDILVAPVCDSDADGSVSCSGETVGGQAITVTSTAADPTVVEVVVDGDTIYSGSIMDVLDEAARSGS